MMMRNQKRKSYVIFLICTYLMLVMFPSNFSHSSTFKNKNEQNSMMNEKIVLLSKTNPSKHCVTKIEVKEHHLFMIDSWQNLAQEKSQRQWKDTVHARYGSVYSNWKDAINKKAECRRIGFGNDEKGNVGTSVICSYAAEPCVNLLDKSK